MTVVPWVNGTVDAVLADLRTSVEQNPSVNGIEYAAAIGMVNGLARGYGDQRTVEARMADIVTVCDAVRLLQEQL